MKIAIAGCGWLGESLAEKLSEKGHEVTGTKRTVSSDNHSFRLLEYNPDEEITEDVRSAFSETDWLVISFPPNRSQLEVYAENCISTIKLSSDSTKILLVSSTGVYSDDLIIAKEEDADHSKQTALLIAEKKLIENYGERLTIIRMAGLFGPDRVIVNHMSKSGKIYNGNEPVNLIHKEDASGICQFVIENDLTGEVINACTPDHPLKSDFYIQLATKLNLQLPTFEAGETGKTVSSEKSLNLGYQYIYQTLKSFGESL